MNILFSSSRKRFFLEVLTPVLQNKLCHAHFQFSANQITWSKLLITYWMTNSADPDQLEANWSGSTLFAKAGYIRAQQDKS